MFDDLAAFYQENVIAEFVDYREISKDGVAGRSRDLRKALVAATALFHIRDHLSISNVPSRGDVEKRCPDYALLGDVVNAAKHKSISNKTPHGDPLVDQATSLEERKLVIEYSDDAGPYRHVLKTVMVKLRDGTERNLLEVMTNVVNHWESYLHTLGVLTTARVFQYEEPIRFRTRSECNDGRLDFEAVKGQRFRQTLQLLRFNEATGKAEAVDLTGTTIRASIYRPSYEIDISLIHDETGQEYKTTVALTEDESMVFHRLSTEAERQSFAYSTPSGKLALQKLALAASLKSQEGSSRKEDDGHHSSSSTEL